MIKIGKKLLFMSIVLCVLLSGCVYFTQGYRMITTILLLFTCIIYCGVKQGFVTKTNIKLFIIIISVLILTFITNLDWLTSTNEKDYVIIAIQLVCLAIITSNISSEKFMTYYINIMFVLAIISLLCFFIQINNTGLIYKISNTSLVDGYTINWFHTWGWGYIFNRNAGPFWEPGAYQGYLVIAILGILNINNYIQNKNLKIKLFLLTITLLTTMSTTGYIIFLFLIIIFLKDYLLNTLNNKSKLVAVIKILFVFLICVYGIQWILNSATISNKFIETNKSYLIRMSDIFNGIKVVYNTPLFGYGIMSSELIDIWRWYASSGASCGLINTFSYIGIIFGVLYSVRFFLNTFKMFNRLPKIILFLVFFIILMTENLVTYPIYMIILFNFKKNNEGEKKII